VDPVPDPLLLRKSGSAENRSRTSGSVVRKSDHWTTEAAIKRYTFLICVLHISASSVSERLITVQLLLHDSAHNFPHLKFTTAVFLPSQAITTSSTISAFCFLSVIFLRKSLSPVCYGGGGVLMFTSLFICVPKGHWRFKHV
jgi:hypothetical protein